MMKKPLACILVVIFCFMSAVQVSAFHQTGLEFNDVKPDHWAYEAVTKMAFLNIVKGYPNGSFYPGKTVSRAEFAVMLVLAADLPTVTPKTPTFRDVPPSHWAYTFVETAKPYLTGYTKDGASDFKGAEPALREDVAAAVVRVKKYENKIADLEHFDQLFTDEALLAPALKKLVAIAVEEKIMTGFPDQTFRGKEPLKRAEAAVLIWKAGIINPKLQDGIVAEANGEPVTLEKMMSRYNKVVISLQDQGADFTGSQGEQTLKALKQQTLDDMINNMIMSQKAKEVGVYPSEDEILQQFQQIKISFGGEEKFKEALEQYHYTEEEIIELVVFDLCRKRLYEWLTAELAITVKDIKAQLGDRYQEYEHYSQQEKDDIEVLIKQEKFTDYVNGLFDSADIKTSMNF